jgi:hypothetical protein
MSIRGMELLSGQRSLRVKTTSGGNHSLHLKTMPLPLSPMDEYSGLLHTNGWIAVACSPRGLQKWSPTKIHVIIALVLLWCLPARANTITAASCSSADVQTAVNSAVDGDTVNVPGPCSTALTVTVHKGVTVNGGGSVIVTTAHAFDISSSASASARITGFIFSGPGDLNNGNVRATTGTIPYRIDHNNFTTAVSCAIATWGTTAGLIDHNTFAEGGGTESIHNFGAGAGSNAGWIDSVVPGGSQIVFEEDNTFNNTTTSVLGGGIQSYYGARTVIRHNLFIFSHLDQHGTPGSVGARWWEAYENTFNTPNVGQSEYITMRGGSGVVFNNHHTGNNTSAFHSITLKEEDTGAWPLAYQIGSGINGQTNGHNVCGALNSSPAYVWGNDADMIYAPGSGVQDGRDVFNSATQPATLLRFEQAADSCSTTYIYVPYPYPHPLQGGSSAPPAAPTGLAAIVN